MVNIYLVRSFTSCWLLMTDNIHSFTWNLSLFSSFLMRSQNYSSREKERNGRMRIIAVKKKKIFCFLLSATWVTETKNAILKYYYRSDLPPYNTIAHPLWLSLFCFMCSTSTGLDSRSDESLATRNKKK